MVEEETIKNGTQIENASDSKKKRKQGIVYLSTIPTRMSVGHIKHLLSKFGEVGRTYFQLMNNKPGQFKKKKKKSLVFSEGWIEFLSKRVAKQVAACLNNQQICAKKKSRYYDEIWNIKYLPRFKWVHLSERLHYEKAVYRQRMRAEIAQAKREANHFVQSVEISEKLKKKQKQQTAPSNTAVNYNQRRTDDEIRNSRQNNTQDKSNRTQFLKGLFNSGVS